MRRWLLVPGGGAGRFGLRRRGHIQGPVDGPVRRALVVQCEATVVGRDRQADSERLRVGERAAL